MIIEATRNKPIKCWTCGATSVAEEVTDTVSVIKVSTYRYIEPYSGKVSIQPVYQDQQGRYYRAQPSLDYHGSKAYVRQDKGKTKFFHKPKDSK